MTSSVVFETVERENWKEMTPEMLLLCNESLERHLKKKNKVGDNGTKPLNLNYIADRIDVDNLSHGFCVRDKETGWLQGFITATTFSSWHEWLHWDSLSVDAQLLPQPSSLENSACEMTPNPTSTSSNSDRAWNRVRKVDRDGRLSRKLEAEFVVDDSSGKHAKIWPHIAEISLLGGLGAGRFLVELLLERLEQPNSPYRFVVTHATHDSIGFYEKLGFVRVGALVRHRRDNNTTVNTKAQTQKHKRCLLDAQAAKLKLERQREMISELKVPERISLLHFALQVFQKLYANLQISIDSSATLKDVLYDLNLLNPSLNFHYEPLDNVKNNYTYPASVFIEAGTVVKIPKYRAPHSVRQGKHAWDLWDHYIARNDETPSMAFNRIKKNGSKYGYLNFGDFLDANKMHIRGLKSKSRLTEGTQLCIPRQDALDFRTYDDVVGYRHWTYATEPYWESPPSYMMVRPLKRRKYVSTHMKIPNKVWENVSPKICAANTTRESGTRGELRATSKNQTSPSMMEYGGSLEPIVLDRIRAVNVVPWRPVSLKSTADAFIPFEKFPLMNSEKSAVHMNSRSNDTNHGTAVCHNTHYKLPSTVYKEVFEVLNFNIALSSHDCRDNGNRIARKQLLDNTNEIFNTVTNDVTNIKKKMSDKVVQAAQKRSNFMDKVVKVKSKDPCLHKYYFVITYVN